MRDSEIYKLLNEKEDKIKLLTNYIDDFTKEQTIHMNSLIMTYNALKNVIVNKGLITTEELNEMAMKEIDKMRNKDAKAVETKKKKTDKKNEK